MADSQCAKPCGVFCCRVHKRDLFWRHWGHPLPSATDILATSSGYILVADTDTDRIVRYSAATLGYIDEWKGQNGAGIDNIFSLAERPNGNILAGSRDGFIQELSPNGVYLTSYSIQGFDPRLAVFGNTVLSVVIGVDTCQLLRWACTGLMYTHRAAQACCG